MAAPRVFVSSTYYDLQHVRNDIHVFLQGLGYDPVMHDKGNVTYTQDTTLEESCYNELDTCDIVICIIGNKFGTKSSNGDYSITMTELKNALKSRKKIYIYILKDVYTENFTYAANKSKDFVPYHAKNIKIHEFISELKETVKNHPIIPFENVSDITTNLKQQFAGLFQRLLSQEATLTESKTYDDLQDTANKIQNLIGDLTTEKDTFFKKFDGTIYAVRPVIRHLLSVLGGKQYDIFANNAEAIKQYLTDIGFSVYEEFFPVGRLVCTKSSNEYVHTLKIDCKIFDSEGNIIDIRKMSEIEKYISYQKVLHNNSTDSDDLPF